MSYTTDELGGVCAMGPAFATPDAGSMTAMHTIDVENLTHGLDRLIKDGVHMIATTGSFGQCWNLFYEEFQEIVAASIQAVNKRVPLMLGVTSSNPREITRKMQFIREQGGEGVLLGLPYYDPLPVRDIPTFYREVAEMFPDMSIMIYHNPPNHRVHIPVRTFEELIKIPNIVCIKDSHRNTNEFLNLQKIIHGHIAHICYERQTYPYYGMGAAGCWSINVSSGPWPVLALWNAARNGDDAKARAIMSDLSSAGSGDDRGHFGNHDIHEYAGYVNVGPPRPPFSFGLRDPEADAKAVERAKTGAERWVALCAKYRPEVEASGVAPR